EAAGVRTVEGADTGVFQDRHDRLQDEGGHSVGARRSAKEPISRDDRTSLSHPPERVAAEPAPDLRAVRSSAVRRPIAASERDGSRVAHTRSHNRSQHNKIIRTFNK